MAVNVVYVYDAIRSDLRGRAEQLEDQLADRGLVDQWVIRQTSSRNQLLLWIDTEYRGRPRCPSVSLIDLRAETGDIEQRGFKVCETIVRHPTLCKANRPLIWTDEHTTANLRQAERVGALAIIDDEWVDRGHGQPLAEVLGWAAALPGSPTEAVGAATRSFPPDNSSIIQEAQERDDRFQRWFGFPPRKLHFALLWGMADAVELKFLLAYVKNAKYAETERIARRELERLQQAMSPQVEALERPEPARAEIARRFLTEAAPPEPSLLSELSWPNLNEVRRLLFERPDVVRWAYLAPGADKLLHRFLDLLKPPDRAIASDWHAAIDASARRVAQDGSQPESTVHELLRSSTHAVDDAFCDWRDYGPPQPLA